MKKFINKYLLGFAIILLIILLSMYSWLNHYFFDSYRRMMEYSGDLKVSPSFYSLRIELKVFIILICGISIYSGIKKIKSRPVLGIIGITLSLILLSFILIKPLWTYFI